MVPMERMVMFAAFHNQSPLITMSLLTHTGLGIIGESIARPAAALNFQVTQVITKLLTAAVIKLA